MFSYFYEFHCKLRKLHQNQDNYVWFFLLFNCTAYKTLSNVCVTSKMRDIREYLDQMDEIPSLKSLMVPKNKRVDSSVAELELKESLSSSTIIKGQQRVSTEEKAAMMALSETEAKESENVETAKVDGGKASVKAMAILLVIFAIGRLSGKAESCAKNVGLGSNPNIQEI